MISEFFILPPYPLITLILIIVLFITSRNLRRVQPGPWGLPILGCYPFLIGPKFHIDMSKMAKKYGDVYVFNFAGQEYVHLNTLEAIQEAHVAKADCFATRFHKYSIDEILFGNTVSFAEGEKWRILRKFLVQSLKHYGIGGSSELFRTSIEVSMKTTLEELTKNDGKLIDLASLLTRTCTRAIRKIFFGDFGEEDYSLEIALAYGRAVHGTGGSAELFVGNFPKYFIFPWLKELRHMKKYKKELDDMLQNVIDDHVQTVDYENPRDFIDLFLIERKTRRDTKDPRAIYFTDEILLGYLLQAFGDGSYALGYFIAIFLTKLSFMPEIQNNVHQEIVDGMGMERPPRWEDRSNLPYTYAVLKELVRTSEFFPANSSLECTKDTTVLGVPVYKGQITVVNNYSAYHDPHIFIDPHTFDPDRFLSDKSLPSIGFGVGKRACVGEPMRMHEAFVVMASICQKFFLGREQDNNVSNLDTDVDFDSCDCNVKVTLRKSVIQEK